jgi:hypothetical protein
VVDISRRHALGWLGLLGGGLLVDGCTPAKLALNWYAAEFADNPERTSVVLSAFTDAILPGADARVVDLTRPLYDTRFPLHPHVEYLAADLCARSRRHFHGTEFQYLSRQDRDQVIADGLSSDRTTRRLYSGAILLTQIVYYAGVYDDNAGCEAIEWEGRFRPRPIDELTYPDPSSFLAGELGRRGSHA